ncbi:hypothetical protein CL656_05385 [bacterium]|nr:hypothetical protein [bacterium]
MENIDIQKYCNNICDYYIINFPLELSNEKYEDIIISEIITNLEQYNDDNINKLLNETNTKEIIKQNVITYMNEKYIMRCNGNTYETIENYNDEYIKIIDDKLNYLKNIKQPEQRTKEWYIFRQEHLTASNLWKVFGTKSNLNQLIYDKCLPLNTDKYKGGFTETPMSWGHKYEDVSIMVYEQNFNTKIRDYGCIPHKEYDYIAASPDGINDDNSKTIYGRMLEIKNIYNRKITGIPKKEYWIQMQLQMEVCDLNECDFLETRFIEYNGYDDFTKDGTFTLTKDKKQKGIMMYIIDKVNECPIYIYMPLDYNLKQFKDWENLNLQKYNNENYEWLKNIYWKLDQFSCVLVKRNNHWFNKALPHLEKVWNIIKKEKEDGTYVKRAPKKRVSKTKQESSSENINNGSLNDALIII